MIVPISGGPDDCLYSLRVNKQSRYSKQSWVATIIQCTLLFTLEEVRFDGSG